MKERGRMKEGKKDEGKRDSRNEIRKKGRKN